MKMKTKIVAALAALAMPLATNAAVAANSAIQIELRFYSDESKTNEIGGSILYCDGSSISWGELFTTYHYTQVVNDCE